MKSFNRIQLCFVIVLSLVLTGLSGAGEVTATAPQQSTPEVTARMLVQPNALMGPGPSSFSWSPKGATLAYVDSQNGRDVLFAYDATTNTKRVLLDPGDNPNQIDLTSAEWSPQGDVILLAGATALWLLDPKTGNLKSLGGDSAGKTSMTFSPDGTRIAYTQDNDLYTIRISDGQTTRLTTDGSDTVFNGTLDWVYNEELATRSAQPAYAWAPDGKWMIHLRLDETDVQNHFVTDYRPVPPTLSYTRYPVAGSPNPKTSLHMIALDTGKSTPIPLASDVEYIMPFFTWFPDSVEAVFVTENRAHSVLELMAWNPTTGKGRTLVKETDPYWVNENSYAAPIFLNDGKQFLWLSERDGFMHLYLFARDGTLVKQLTQGAWMIDSPAWNLLIPGKPVFVNPEGTHAYFATTKNSPLERQTYRVEIATGKLDQVSKEAGFHLSALSGDGNFLVDQFSDVATPPITTILKSDGTPVQVLGKSAGPSIPLPKVSREFLKIKAHDGTDLYAQIVKPENFDAKQKYPVVIHWYGGPTLQLVSNRYGATNIFNHIERDVLYTQAGFIVWRLDNRGSFGRGHAFETPIYKELGKAALDDQIAGVEYLRTLPYIDATRIGTDGKSFGGYMTLYALIHASDVFQAGVAGSGPTDWAYYDTIYTERYMQQPTQNPAGYAATELVSRVNALQVAPLIIHGLADTNVHLQNSVNFMQALEQSDKPFDFIPLPNSDHHYGGDGLATVLAASATYFTRYLGNR
ncbi:MAG: DPP IV N-terminal domain-containing protein [Chloroflexi bacterium]|nr:DPP IV N-terminal domain-containing protein [Chloroflexota bacterium]